MKIDEYEVMYSSNVNAPRIWLKSNNKYIGQLIFNSNGSALDPDIVVNDQVYLFYHLEDYHNIIDLLRNEQPMYLLYIGTGSGNENGIKTTTEIVGAGEH